MDADELNAGDENGMEESNAKRFKINHEHYVLPTTEELYALKNTENLYQSNLLKLQVCFFFFFFFFKYTTFRETFKRF